MRILTLMIISIFALLSGAAEAKMEEKTMLCLSINTIHEAALKMRNGDIDGYQHIYTATIKLLKDNQFWFIMAHNIVANSTDEAAQIAQKRCVNVSHMVYQNARKGALRNDEYSCLYYDQTLPDPFVSIIAIRRNL